jgi:hypothetical protein
MQAAPSAHRQQRSCRRRRRRARRKRHSRCRCSRDLRCQRALLLPLLRRSRASSRSCWREARRCPRRKRWLTTLRLRWHLLPLRQLPSCRMCRLRLLGPRRARLLRKLQRLLLPLRALRLRQRLLSVAAGVRRAWRARPRRRARRSRRWRCRSRRPSRRRALPASQRQRSSSAHCCRPLCSSLRCGLRPRRPPQPTPRRSRRCSCAWFASSCTSTRSCCCRCTA